MKTQNPLTPRGMILCSAIVLALLFGLIGAIFLFFVLTTDPLDPFQYDNQSPWSSRYDPRQGAIKE